MYSSTDGFCNWDIREDLVLFYSFDHGVLYKEQNYFLRVDVSDEIEEDIETMSINAHSILTRLASQTSYNTIFILDFSRKYRLCNGSRSPRPLKNLSGFHWMIPPPGTLL